MSNVDFIKRLWQYIRGYRLRFLLSYLVLVVELVSTHILPLLVGEVVDAAVYQSNMQIFLRNSFVFAVAFCFQQGASFFQLQLWQRLNNKFVYDLRVKCYERVLRLKATKLADINTGDMIRTINGDTMDFHHIIQKNLMRSFNAILGTVFSIVMILLIRWELALAIVILVPLSVSISHRMNINIKKLAKESRNWGGMFSTWIWECFNGIQEIKLFAAERNVVKSFQDKNDKTVELSYRQEKQRFVFEQVISVIFFVSQIVFYVVSAIFVAKQTMDIADYVTVASFYSLISRNVQRVFRDTVQYQNRKVAIERVYNLMETEFEDDSNLKELNVSEGRVEIKNLTFSYNNNNAVLNDFSGVIEAGSQVGVVGASGVGKSTLAYVLSKFYFPEKGSIYIDGQDIAECTYSSIRKNVGMVSQEAIVFDGSIKYNVCFDEEENDDKVWEALEKAYLAEDIRQIPGGINAVLGSEGVDLSGGQRQRLVIARMFYRNPKIIILDEATSALDVGTEKLVQQALDKLTEEKTSIVISHRINSIIQSEEIWIIKDGVLVMKGTYDDLSKNNKEFKELFMI